MIAALLIVLGLALRLWAVITNRSFTFRLTVPRRLCTSGPYRYVRHPGYTGGLIFMLGVGALIAGWGASVLCTWTLAHLLIHRAHIEEQILMQHFSDYAAYHARTGMFLPRVA